MKKNLILILVLLTAACQPHQQNPPAAADMFFQEKIDRSVFLDGLSTSYKNASSQPAAASLYQIEYTLQEDLSRVAGREKILYTNQEEIPLNEVRFHLFPNILGGRMTISAVLVNDQVVQPHYQLFNSILRVPLDTELKPGQSIAIQMEFVTEAPTDLDRNYGVLADTGGMVTLAHAYPMAAVYDSRGWAEQIPSAEGDLTYADAAFFIVRVNAPASLTLAGSGREIGRQTQGGVQTVTYAAGPARDFFLAAGKDFTVIQETREGLTIRSYAPRAKQQEARQSLDLAFRAIGDFSQIYSPYAYTQLNIVATPTLALGIEYPGLIVITNRIYNRDTVLQGVPASALLESTIAHEAAHQWFYNLIGNDQLNEPWLDEALAQFATLEYYEKEYGQGGAEGFRQSLEQRWARTQRAEIPLDLPVSAYQGAEYGSIIYGRGPLFIEALESQMGAPSFHQFLKDYLAAFSWRIAGTQDFQALAEQDCGCNLRPLFDEWVYSSSQ